jgi:acetyl esterase/lipase
LGFRGTAGSKERARRRAGLVALAVAAACAIALGFAPPASADLATLEATCTGPMHPVGANGQAIDSLGYRYCDDGTPPAGGRTPNPGGQQAIMVPAAYRYPDPVPAGVADRTVDGLPPLDPGGASSVGGADPTGHVALDVDLTLPTTPAPPGGYPVVVMMHGCCSGSRTSWESGNATTPGNIDAKGEKWHYNNVWFASRGYVVVTYTARGFVDGNNHGSTGETQIDSLQYEINDYQYLVGLLADDPTLNVDPAKVVVTGGSYGGGFSWLAFTDPLWSSPGGRAIRLAAVAPKYGWTDLAYSLLPTGRHFYDFGSPPATDGSDSGLTSPVGIPIRSIIAGLFLAGTTGVPPGSNHATFPQAVTDSFNCTQTVYPAESNPLCGSAQAALLPDFIRYRSAYYRNDFFSRLASDPAYRIPVFDAGTHTDPLFPPVENHRMVDRLRATVPGYPVKEYYGDYQHFEQNKDKEWGDVCTTGGSRHVCGSTDYPNGDFNAEPAGLARTGATTLLNRFVDHYAQPTGDPSAPQPSFDATASLQVCPQNAGAGQPADEPGPTFTAPTYGALAPGVLNIDLSGDQQTTSSVPGNERGASSDPVVNQQTNHGGACPVERGPAPPGVATYESQPLPANATMIGGTVVTAKFTASGTDGVELNARLYDLFPDGTAVMVDRGPRRLSAAEAQRGEVQFQLHGNGWEFPAGHKVRVELTQDDEPYLKHSDVPSSLALGHVALRIPIHQPSFAGGQAFAPAAKMLAPRVASSTSTGPRFRIRWRGSSIGSPIAGFQVQTRTLGTASARASVVRWRTIRGLAATRRTSLRFRGREGRTYQFRVRARTAAGRLSRWSSATTVVPLDERRRGFRYRGPWHRARVRGAFRGRVVRCSSRRCAVSFRYRGATLYLVGRTGPTGGRARIVVDRTRRTVDFYSRRPGSRRIVLRVVRRSATHRVRVAVLHRHRRASRGFVVAIDAYGLARR